MFNGTSPIQSSSLFQHFKHVVLKHIQPLVTASIYIRPDDLKVQWWLLRIWGIKGGNLSERITVAASLVILVAEHGDKEAADEFLDEAGHIGYMGIISSIQVPPRLQQHPVQHEGVAVYQRLRLVVSTGIVKHEHQVLHQCINILVLVSQHVALDLLHVYRFLDGNVVVRKLGTRRQPQEDSAEATASFICEVLDGLIKLIQLLL